MYANIQLEFPSKGIMMVYKVNREVLPKISGSVAFDHPQTEQVYLLIFHQCIHSDHLDHNLLCQMSFRMNGVEINETPKFLLENPTYSIHAIIVEKPEGGGLLVFPILINGVKSYFTCQNLKISEYKDRDLPIIDFSVESPDWDTLYQDYAQR